MNAKVVALVVIFVTNFKICQSKSYENYTLFGTIPTEVDHLTFLQNLEKQKYIDVIFWNRPLKLYHDVQFIVNPIDFDIFIERAHHFKLHVDLLIRNIQSSFDRQTIRRYARLRDETYSWETYHSLDDVYQWISDIALKYSKIVDLYTVGKSVEGREIFAVGIKRGNPEHKVFIEGGIHGCEWISVEFVTYLINALIHAQELGNPKFINLAYKHEWYLVPTLNPDGYEYSQIKDRLFRKNKRKVGADIGVNLNRNFDYSFGKYDCNKNTKEETYCGPSAFSEPETRALYNFLLEKGNDLRYYFSIHGYGQKLIIPFGDRINHVENYSEMENYGKQAILKMFKLYGNKYSVGTFYDTMGLRISGNSASWVKKALKVKYVYTFLLRDNGTYGHALPPEHILPACKEALTGLTEIMTTTPKRVRADLLNSSSKITLKTLLLLFKFFVVVM